MVAHAPPARPADPVYATAPVAAGRAAPAATDVLLDAALAELPIVVVTRSGSDDMAVAVCLPSADGAATIPVPPRMADAVLRELGRRVRLPGGDPVDALMSSALPDDAAAVVVSVTPEPEPMLLRAGRVALDRERLELVVDDRRAGVTRTECRLLSYLIHHANSAVDRDALSRAAFDRGHHSGASRALDHHLSRLRRKLARLGAGDAIDTVWGVGYRLSA